MKPSVLYIYYVVLVVILMSWTSITSAPPMSLRLAFMAAVVLPGFWSDKGILPASLTCFWVLTSNGYAYSYMPTSGYLYAIVMVLAVISLGNNRKNAFKQEMRLWWYFLAYVTILNCISNVTVDDLSFTLLIVILFTYFIGEDKIKKAIGLFSIAFMIVTVVISYYVLTMSSNIILQNLEAQGRTGWVDPNYMGMQVGFGGLIGAINIFRFKELDLVQKILSPIAIIASLPAILLTGSRGAALCFAAGIIVLLLSYKTNIIYKIIIISALVVFVVYLYNGKYMDLLINRIGDDGESGSIRINIWLKKTIAFIAKNPLYWLIGCGHENALILGSNKTLGFHNDYLAIICSYGIIGFVLFIRVLLYPLIKINRLSNLKYEVYACLIYLLIAMLTLEPMSFGICAFYVFLLYVFLKTRYSWIEYE